MAILQHANISCSSTGENVIVAGVTGMQVLIHRIMILNGAATAMTVTVLDKTSGSTLATIPLPSSIGGGPILGQGDLSQSPVFRTQTSGAFILSLSTNTQVSGFCQYEQR